MDTENGTRMSQGGEQVAPELEPYMDALPDCPWEGMSKVEWVSDLVNAVPEPPYPYPYKTKLEWVRNLAELDEVMALENEWADRYAERLGL